MFQSCSQAREQMLLSVCLQAHGAYMLMVFYHQTWDGNRQRCICISWESHSTCLGCGSQGESLSTEQNQGIRTDIFQRSLMAGGNTAPASHLFFK